MVSTAFERSIWYSYPYRPLAGVPDLPTKVREWRKLVPPADIGIGVVRLSVAVTVQDGSKRQ
jgi:hypothetical protein